MEYMNNWMDQDNWLHVVAYE